LVSRIAWWLAEAVAGAAGGGGGGGCRFRTGVSEEQDEVLDEELVAELDEEPSGELEEEPADELDEEPSGELDEELVAELDEEPSGELEEEPADELDEEPSGELEEEPADELDEGLVPNWSKFSMSFRPRNASSISKDVSVVYRHVERAPLFRLVRPSLNTQKVCPVSVSCSTK
jgi:hypothetical protein